MYTTDKTDMRVGDIVQVTEMPGRYWKVIEHRYYDVRLVPCQVDGSQTEEDTVESERMTEFWLLSTVRSVDAALPQRQRRAPRNRPDRTLRGAFVAIP